MIYLALGCALLAGLIWASRQDLVLKFRGWRYASAAFAVAAFAGCAYASLRGAWEPAVVLFVVGLWLAASVRRPPDRPRAAPIPPRNLSDSEARAILGVDEQATVEEIQAAYTRLMRLAHPDKGGTDGLAAQLNGARDRLLRR